MEQEIKSRAVLYVGPESDLQKQIRILVDESKRDLAWHKCESVYAMNQNIDARNYEAFIIDARIKDYDSLVPLLESRQEPSAPARILIYSHQRFSIAPFQSYRGLQTYLLDENRIQRFPIILERALKHRRLDQRLQVISQMARAIASTLDIDQIFEILGSQLQNVIEFRRLSLRVLNSDHNNFDTWDIKLQGRKPCTEVNKGVRLSEEETTLLNEVLSSQEAKVVSWNIPDSMKTPTVRAYALIPLVGNNESNGVLSVGFRKAPIQDETVEILQDLAVHMCIALQNTHASRRLEDVQNQLFQSEKLQVLGELAAGIAHDFNNLLSAILGRAQMLKITIDDDETLRSIEVIEQAALDGARTVARIQEYTKASTCTDFVPITVDALVQETVERAKSSVRARERKNLTVNLDLKCEAFIRGNLSELRQVLTNLIFNAVDAMPEGGQLHISSGTENDNKSAWFAVKDQGIGMDAFTQTQMFNPFFTTKGTEGTGLGLSVSNSIIERHRGNFVVTSTVGEGTTVKVCLPTCPPASEQVKLIDPRKPWHPAPVPPAKKSRTLNARILVIDDDDNVLEVLSNILRTGHHTVVPVNRASQGLEMFRMNEFDLVFTDLGMPEMNGWEVASKIKSLNPETPVGLITEWGTSLDERRMKHLGVDLIVSKPFRCHEILDLVTEAITNKDGLDR